MRHAEKFFLVGAILLAAIFKAHGGNVENNVAMVSSLGQTSPEDSVPLLILPSPAPISTDTPPAVLENPVLQAISSLDSAASAFIRVHDDPLPQIGAVSALVADVKTGEVYVGLDPEKRWPIASLAKLMTAVIASENSDLTKPITLTEEDFTATNYSVADILKPGQSFSGDDLLSVMLLPSSNEAGHAFARAYGEAQFMSLMNDKARAWSLHSTYFADSTGLSSADQSTATDLKDLAVNIYNHNPGIFQITRSLKKSVLDLKSKTRQVVTSINNFAGKAGFLGGKTGSTPDASGNLLSLFSYNNRPLVIVVLGTEDRFGDTQKLLDWFKNDFKPSR